MNKLASIVKEGLITKNPTFFQLLGMCPTLAVTTTVFNSVGMGLATTAVLCCSNVMISLLRKLIPGEVRIASYIVIISGFVTAVDLLMKAYFVELSKTLGLFIPLIVVNCIILARAEAFASKNKVIPSLVDGLSMGLGFTMALSILGAIRESLGSGTLLSGTPFMIQIPGLHDYPVLFMVSSAGAFVTLGCLVALVQFIAAKVAESKAGKDEEPLRARSEEVEKID
ncbi:MAG: electron transport complex subunit E [Clostridiales bacterium]|nr:electron transport complex subunit E [Clostridiales bacterium]